MKKLLFVVLALLMAPAALAQGTYRIQPGDVLDISVLEDANLNRKVLVRPDGGISMPIAGNVQAGGRTIANVEQLLIDRLKPGFSITPTVSVALSQVAVPTTPATPVTTDVYFIGQVGKPGLVQLKPGSTLLQALAAAGGLGQFAAEKRIQLRRTDRGGRETVFLFDYGAVQRGARITNNLVVQPGDTIVVPERRLFE